MARGSEAGAPKGLALPDGLMTGAGFLLIPAALCGYPVWELLAGAAEGGSVVAGVAGLACAAGSVVLFVSSLAVRRRRLSVAEAAHMRGQYPEPDADPLPEPPLFGGNDGGVRPDWPRV